MRTQTRNLLLTIRYQGTAYHGFQVQKNALTVAQVLQDALEAVLGEVAVDKAVRQKLSDGEKAKAPGMKYRHYAPRAAVTVVTGAPRRSAAYIAAHLPAGAGVICFDEYAPLFAGHIVHRLGPAGDKLAQAQRVFDALREFDHEAVTEIYAQCPDTAGLGLAVANRLKKAAGQNLVQVESYEACSRVIFVSKDNITLGPMNEWILKSILMDKEKEVLSRGLVVLFEEPRNMKITDILINHGVPCEEQVSVAFSPEEVTRDTVIITMNFAEKVKVLEDYGLERNVYTLRELAGEEGDTEPPLGGDEEAYEASYTECKDLLYKIKKKLQWR